MAKIEETMNLHINISPDEYENLVQYNRLLVSTRTKANQLCADLKELKRLAKEVQDACHISVS